MNKLIKERPDRKRLVDTNVLPESRADSSLQSAIKSLEISRSHDQLNSRLKRRQSPTHLMNKGILLVDPKEQVNGQLQAAIASRAGQKQDSKNLLAKFMVERPSMKQLVQEHENLIPEHTMVWSLSITDGLEPFPRNCHTLTHVKNSRGEDKLYLLGGYGSDQPNALLVYDVRNNTWSQPLVAGRAPIDRYSHTCVAVGSQLVFWGGYSMTEHWLNDLHFLDTDFQQSFKPPIGTTQDGDSGEMLLWYQSVAKGVAPCPRAAHSATVVGKKVFFFAGNDGKHLFNDLHILDTETMEWIRPNMTGTIPAPRAGHTASLVGSKIVVFGGGTQMGPVNDLHILDTVTMQWERPDQHGSPPSPRAGHSCITVFKTHILVFGGGFLDKAFNDLHLYDVETSTWSRPNDTRPPTPRAGHSCTSCGDRLFLFGGGDSERVYNDLFCLDTAPAPPWSSLGEPPSRDLSQESEEGEACAREAGLLDIQLLLDKMNESSSRMSLLLDNTTRRIQTKALEHKAAQEELRVLVQRLESAHLMQYDELLLEVETVKKAVSKEFQDLRKLVDNLRSRRNTAEASPSPSPSPSPSHSSQSAESARHAPSSEVSDSPPLNSISEEDNNQTAGKQQAMQSERSRSVERVGKELGKVEGRPRASSSGKSSRRKGRSRTSSRDPAEKSKSEPSQKKLGAGEQRTKQNGAAAQSAK